MNSIINTVIKLWYPEKYVFQKWWFKGRYDKKSKNQIENALLKLEPLVENSINFWNKNAKSCLAGILYYDQFYRHIQKNTKKHSLLSINLCFYCIQKKWIPISPHYLVFFLMPLRHSNNKYLINFSKEIICFMHQKENSLYYTKFLKASSKIIKCEDSLLKNDNTWLNYFIKYNSILCNKINYEYNNDTGWIFTSIAWKYFMQFIENRRLENCNKSIIISLSGGVDSMVFLYLCQIYKNINNNFKFGIVHINWNQRKESEEEFKFLKKYLEINNIDSIFENITHISRKKDRKEFESKGRKIRMELYKKAIKIWNGDSVFLGHHMGDIRENIFTNSIKGENFLDLGKMKIIDYQENVCLCRPFLKIDKEDIYMIAKKELIPFFKDSTPKWSNRSKIRDHIFPEIEKYFGKTYKKGFERMADQSFEYGDIILKNIVNPYLKKIIKKDSKTYRLPYNSTFNLSLYKLIFEKLFHSIDKSKIKIKSIESWYYNNIEKQKYNKFNLSKECTILLDKKLQFLLIQFL
jgi:tRNA(Ile)-lysidine synthetase-like protein